MPPKSNENNDLQKNTGHSENIQGSNRVTFSYDLRVTSTIPPSQRRLYWLSGLFLDLFHILAIFVPTKEQDENMPKDENSSHEKGQAPSVVIPLKNKNRQRTPKRRDGITDKQQAFIDAIIEGHNLSEAYRLAYNAQNMSAASIHVEACRLAASPNVSLVLDRHYQMVSTNNRMLALSRSERVIQKLEEIGIDSTAHDGTQVHALKLLMQNLGMLTQVVELEDKTERTEQQLEKDIQNKLIALGIK